MPRKQVVIHDYERIARYRAVRASVRPKGCLVAPGYLGLCWVEQGPLACRDCACVACHKGPSLAGNEAKHSSLLTKVIESE